MDLPSQIRQALQTSQHPIPSISWLTSLTTSRNPPPPLQSLIATAKARLLSSDITQPGLLDPSQNASFPSNVNSTDVTQRTLTADTPVQILDIENLTRSRWEQVEELEALERGEGTRGREIIRLPTGGEDEDGEDLGDSENQTQTEARTASRGGNAAASGAKNATHRLVLQDCKGQNVYGLELKRMEKLGVGVTAIGEKMVLKRGTVVARGTVLLDPANCVLLGGRVEAWQRPWVEGRLKRLREAVGADRPS